MNHIKKAASLVTQVSIAESCGVSGGAVGSWISKGRLPLTEVESGLYKKKTNYAEVIERLTNGEVTKEQLHQDIYDHYNKRAA